MKPNLMDQKRKVTYTPQVWNVPKEDANEGNARTNLIQYIQQPPTGHPRMWILVDEAQLTYLDREFWDALYSVALRKPPVHVIAAGSYGSHTGSSSHSPPPGIDMCHRMNLFYDKSDDCFLAFTRHDVETYMRQVVPPASLTPYIEAIQSSASPCLDQSCDQGNWDPGFHPGVIAGMTLLLSEKVRCALFSLVM